MSRFLSSYRRLRRRIEKFEAERLGGDLGPALAESAVTGRLPEQPRLRRQVLRCEAAARAMASTIPSPGQADEEQPNQETRFTDF